MNSKKKEKRGRFYRTVVEFGECTSFHGVKYVVSQESSIYEKIFWILVVAAGFCGAIYMTMIFWERFNSNPIRITIEPVNKHTTVVYFPSITVIAAITQVPKKVDKFINKLILPGSTTIEDVKKAFPAFMGYIRPVTVSNEDIELLEQVFQLNKNYTVAKIFTEIQPSCKDIILKCRWEQKIIPCEDLFETIPCFDGFCCSFNSKFGRPGRKFKNARSLFYGPLMGLSVILNPMTEGISTEVSTLSSTGVKFLINHPGNYPGLNSVEKIIGNGTESYIRILATKLKSSEDIQLLKPEQRGCLFKHEKTLKYFEQYRDKNCLIECRINKCLHYCKCVPFTFIKTNNTICSISDIPCISKNYNAIFKNAIKNAFEPNETQNYDNFTILPECYCPSHCNDVFYSVQTSSILLKSDVPTITNFYQTEGQTNIPDKMAVHIYFGSYYHTEMIRDTITSTYYLLSSFGGVFSLFLGCSFLSILEFLYFFCYRIFTKYNN